MGCSHNTLNPRCRVIDDWKWRCLSILAPLKMGGGPYLGGMILYAVVRAGRGYCVVVHFTSLAFLVYGYKFSLSA